MRARDLDPPIEIAGRHVAPGRLPFAIVSVFRSGTWAGAHRLIHEVPLAVDDAVE